MRRKTGDWFVARLKAWGVSRVYGCAGVDTEALRGALQRDGTSGDPIKFIRARQIQTAAFMAAGHARFTGELGVCLVSGDVGATNLLAALCDAQLEQLPILVILGQAQATLEGSCQRELNLGRGFSDVAQFVAQADLPAALPQLTDTAIHTAISRRGVSVLILPQVVHEHSWKQPRSTGYRASRRGNARPAAVPDDKSLRQAAQILNQGKRVAILIGAGARSAHAELVQVASLLGAGVAKTLPGKDVLSDDLPFVTGIIGAMGTKPSQALMKGCDTLFMIGTRYAAAQFLPAAGQARTVRIDTDPVNLGACHPLEAALQGDAARTLQSLLPLLQHRPESRWAATLAADTAKWWQLVELHAMTAADPVNPQRVAWEMTAALPANAVVVCESGTAAACCAVYVRIKQGQRGVFAGGRACMGTALAGAIGAKFAQPSRPVVVLSDSGAMQNGMADLIAVKDYQRHWADPRFIVCVLNDEALPAPHARVAELIGWQGLYVDHPEQVSKAWVQALRADRPTVIEVRTDPKAVLLPAAAGTSAWLDSIGLAARRVLELWRPAK